MRITSLILEDFFYIGGGVIIDDCSKKSYKSRFVSPRKNVLFWDEMFYGNVSK